MAARSPRRTFANPFVVTLAAITPLAATTVFAEPDTKPSPPSKNPPAPKPEAKPNPKTVNPPPPKPVPKPEPAKFERHWTVSKIKGKASCEADPDADCPKPEPGKPRHTCNPPPPIDYACPSGLADGETLKIVLRVGATECFQERAPTTCPPNAKCNPPPPRKLACPSR